MEVHAAAQPPSGVDRHRSPGAGAAPLPGGRLAVRPERGPGSYGRSGARIVWPVAGGGLGRRPIVPPPHGVVDGPRPGGQGPCWAGRRTAGRQRRPVGFPALLGALPAGRRPRDRELRHLLHRLEPRRGPRRVELLDAGHLRARAAAAREAGAEFVVASLHWGQEYRQAPTAEQRSVADALLADGGVDLIVGHHAHVVQPLGRVAGRPVAFGLGNFLSNQSGACCATGGPGRCGRPLRGRGGSAGGVRGPQPADLAPADAPPPPGLLQ